MDTKNFFQEVADHFFQDATLIVLSLFFMAVAILLYLYYSSKSARLKADSYALQLYAVLSSSTDIWCSWSKGGKNFVYDKRLRALFGVDKYQIITYKDLVYFLQEIQFNEFLTNLETVGLFSKEVSFSSEVTLLLVGKNVVLGDRKFSIFWIKDVSTNINTEQIQGEIIEQISQERDLLKELLDSVPFPIWFKNQEKKVIFCNAAYAKSLDADPETVITEQVKMQTWRQSGRALDLTDLVLRKRATQSQQQHTIIQGERRLVNCVEKYSKRGGVLGYFEDLTDLESLRNEFDQLTHGTRELLEKLSTPIIIFNSQKQVEFFNGAYVNMFEMDRKWLEEKPLYVELLDELRAKRRLPEMSDFQTYKQTRLDLFRSLSEPEEDTLYFTDGRTIRMVTAPYHNGGLMIMFNDLSDWLGMERQYNTLLAVHKQVADNLFEGLVVFGTDHRLKLYNKAFCRMWSFIPEDLNNFPHLDEIVEGLKGSIDFLHYDSSWEKFRKRLITKVTERKKTKEGRVRLHNDVVYDYIYTPLPDGSHLLSFIDISDRYQIEKALLERGEALELAHSIKSDFIENVFRSLKTPLQTMTASLGTISKSMETLPKRHQNLCISALDQAVGLQDFIDSLYELASIDSDQVNLNITSIDILNLIKQVAGTHEAYAQKESVQVSLSLPEVQVPQILGDQRRLKQVFFNLIRNAILYSQKDQKITIALTFDADNVVVDVDTPTAAIPYEDAYTASVKMKKGDHIITGLGYSLARKIFKLHGGAITVDWSNGTHVRCRLPFAKK